MSNVKMYDIIIIIWIRFILIWKKMRC